MSSIQQSADDSACAAADSVSRSTPRLWFITEIQHMMHGFGDCRKPLSETAALVEEIVYRQMIETLYKAEDVRRLRNSRFVNIEEFLFLLRRDKVKLKRLLHYLDLKDQKTAALKNTTLEDEEVTETDVRQPLKKRRKICHDFLCAIDNTGELVALLDDSMDDEIKLQRKLRAEVMTRNMNIQQYMEFCEARQASFAPRYRLQKFKEWLLSNVSLEIKLSPFAIEILSYLAFETVAQIVDLALIVKRDMNVSIDDPFSHEISPVYCGLSTPVLPSSGEQTSAKTTGNFNGAISSSPPSTPELLGQSNIQNGSSVPLFKQKPKRLKQSTSQLSLNILTSQAITPSEVREALRRYSQAIGPFADFSQCVSSNIGLLQTFSHTEKEPLLPCASRHFAC